MKTKSPIHVVSYPDTKRFDPYYSECFCIVQVFLYSARAQRVIECDRRVIERAQRVIECDRRVIERARLL